VRGSVRVTGAVQVIARYRIYHEKVFQFRISEVAGGNQSHRDLAFRLPADFLGVHERHRGTNML
jgi:hypothetical protein